MGAPWKIQTLKALAARHRAGEALEALAAEVGRSPAALRVALRRVGYVILARYLPKPEEARLLPYLSGLNPADPKASVRALELSLHPFKEKL